MSRFIHPVLFRSGESFWRGGSIIDVERLNQYSETLESPAVIAQPDDFPVAEVIDFEEFQKRLARDRNYRESLGIPEMNYLAYSFDYYGQDKIPQIIQLLEKCREFDYEVRAWTNPQTGRLVICAATDDLTEDSGWNLYEWAEIKGNVRTDDYEHSCWWEFCQLGIPIYENWKLENRNNRLVVTSPDQSRFAIFG